VEAWSSRLGVGCGVDNPTLLKPCYQKIQGRLWPIKGCHADDDDDYPYERIAAIYHNVTVYIF
jgi:hypothetical protein